MDPWEDNKIFQQMMTQNRAAYQASGILDGFLLPLLKSVFLGFVAGVFCSLASWAAKFSASPWLVFALVWFGITGISFIRYSERGQWLIERICGADLNGDSYIGPPPQPEPQKIRVELLQEGGKAGDYIDLPFYDRLPQLAAGLLQGSRTFNQTAWTGQGQLFSRAEFEQLRGEMIRRGLARWKNESAPAQGVELTLAGKAIFRRLAELPATLPQGK